MSSIDAADELWQATSLGPKGLQIFSTAGPVRGYPRSKLAVSVTQPIVFKQERGLILMTTAQLFHIDVYALALPIYG